jgi:hypothetical protein
MFRVLFSLFFLSFHVEAGDINISDAVRKYVDEHGVSSELTEVYGIDSPDNGYKSYFLYNEASGSDTRRFIFNQRVDGEVIPRCNLLFIYDGNFLIPNRLYKSGSSEDWEPCLGIRDKVRTIRGRNGVDWYLTKTIYHVESDEPDVIDEVYLYKDGKFCYSDEASTLLSKGEKVDYIINKPLVIKNLECSE